MIKVRHARGDTKVGADLLECSSSIDSGFHSPGRKGTEGYRHCATYNLKTERSGMWHCQAVHGDAGVITLCVQMMREMYR